MPYFAHFYACRDKGINASAWFSFKDMNVINMFAFLKTRLHFVAFCLNTWIKTKIAILKKQIFKKESKWIFLHGGNI